MLTKKQKKINFPDIQQNLSSLLWISLAICFVVGMVIQPKIVYEGSLSGLKAWWNIVFPSLLPFFIASEILMKLGLVRFMGVLLEPVMRPLFNVPGTGAFVMVIGFTSGFPIGSMVTAKLRQQKLCTRLEAERLMSFTNNSSPLFMLTAVAVGMFGRPDLGVVIAGSHYLANLLLGLVLRFYGRQDSERTIHNSQVPWSFRQALRILLHNAKESPPLGQLLGEAVASSVSKLLNIGGFIILFAVIIRLLKEIGVIHLISTFLSTILLPLGFSPDVVTAISSGFFEMTIGTKLASEANAPELQRLMAVGIILGWSGLSIHAQVASMIAQTDIRMRLFMITRVAHAVLAGFFTWLFYKPIASSLTLPVMTPVTKMLGYSPLSIITGSLCLMGASFLLLIFVGLTIQLCLRIHKIFSHL
ncbi:sporulation integral membrane protein YlbJ [Desulforamulus aeronauticus DSM 10349]|uniref:Sporulation integral membrane protein YlbJ n=1 Tax=Desulforamulus aeronauticus DSM 10349 TaxID=1121421 RepID=A0A1M6W2F1_9FIRM|nr:sporulation integral membrane protein YlbJ [Desulforamulus aeronauticus]SHK87839.1 sporulation integral membrane protein YlbJ [Desulforamulus aeronauticus DSM 10349]